MSEHEALVEHMRALSPSAQQTARIKTKLDDALEAAHTSLAAEWLELLRMRPLAHTLYAVAAAAALLFVTPLGSLPFALLRGAG